MESTARRFLAFSILTLLTLGLPAAASAQPTLSKVFTPNTIGPGSVSTITFTITNNTGAPVTDLAFTDVLPTVPGDVDIAVAPNASTDCQDATLTAPAGGGTITLFGGELGVGASCTVTVDVTAGTPGTHTNPAITLTSSAGSGMSLPADLTVDAALPGFSKSFLPGSVPLGGRSTLTLTIDNSANASNVLNLDFTDNLPVGMVIADPAVASTTCGTATLPPTLTAAAGTSTITLDANGTFAFPALAVGATCTVTVAVVGTAAGQLENVTGDLLASFVSAGKASATLEVTRTDLAIDKDFTDDPVPPGGSATLEFTITNFDRNFSATGIGFTDDLAAALPGLTYDSLLSNDCSGTVAGVGGTTITFSGGTLAPEASCTIQVSLSVPAGATPGTYTNVTGAVTGTVDGSPVTGNMALDPLFVEPVPILTKEFLEVGTLAPDPVIEPGDDVVIRFTVTNTSTTSGATDITFVDELTDGGPGTGFLPFPVTVTLPPVPNPPCGGGSSLALVSVDTDRQGLELTGGDLTAAPGPGDSCTFDVTLTVPADLGPGIYTNTTEEITATVDGATRTGEPASDTLTVIAAPELSKAFIDDPVAPGGTVTLEFTLSHSPDASGDATDITFTDDLAPVLAGLTANLPPTPDPPCGGGSTLTGSAGDTLLTLMGGSLMPGEICTFSVTLDVPVGAAPGTYTNTTSGVGATVGGLATTSPPASDDLSIAGLDFQKEFLGDPVIPGDTVTLRFTIDNIHPTDDATITFFTDNLSAELPGLAATGAATMDTCGGTLSGTTFLIYTGGSVTSGSSCIIEVEVLVPLGAADGDYLNITSSLSATQGGAVTIDPAVDTLTVNSNLLQVVKTFTDDPVAPGDPVTLELVLSNLDPTEAASGIAFSDDLGAALAGLTFDSVLFDDCGGTVSGMGTDMVDVSGVSLAAGASCTIRLSLTVPGGAAAGLYPNTTSAVTGTIGGFTVSGDTGSDELEVLQLLDFSKSFDGPTTATGTAILTFTITNPGAETVTGISFTDDLDAVLPGLIAISLPALPCGASSEINGISFLTMSGGELPPMGGTCSFDVVVQVPAGTAPGTYPNATSELFVSGLEVAEPATADLVIEPPPTFAKAFAPSSIGLGQVATLTFTIDNSASAVAADALDFTDDLPAGVVVAAVPNAATTCTGGTITAAPGGGTISYSGGSVAAGAVCTVSVDVTGTAPGSAVNTSGDLTSTSGSSGTATDTLTINPQPGFAKVFAPDSIGQGQVSTLTFTIDNSASTVAATGLDFTDVLPTEITAATPANAATTCVGGTLTAVDGSGTISYSGGSVAAGAVCTVSVDVTSSTSGDHVNTSGPLTSSLGSSGTATDTLTVNPQPIFEKRFQPDTIFSGDTSTLEFLIDNAGSTVDATGLDFTDVMPVALTVATPANAATTCTGGTIGATPGSGTITYTGGTVAAGAMCTVSVDVTGTTPGSHVNDSGPLTSSLGSSGTASDTLDIELRLPGFSKVFAPNPIFLGQVSTLTFTIDNSTNPVAVGSLDFTDDLPAGMVVATPGNASTTCIGGTLTAPDGASTISYTSGGTAPAAGSCTVSVDVTTTDAGDFVNTSGDLDSEAGTSGAATDTLTVAYNLPGFAKSFAPTAVLAGDPSTLTLTIDNSANIADLPQVAVTDTLPAGLVVATPGNASTTCIGGTLTAVDGSGVISYTGGTAPASASCTITVDVTAAAAGTYVNTTGDLTSAAGNSGTASATLEVVEMLTVSKAFLAAPVLPGGTVELEFTLENPSALAAMDISFTDDLDAALAGLVAVGLPLSDVCGAGSELSGTSVLTLTGGSLGPGASCTFSASLVVPADAQPGTYTNATSSVTYTTNSRPIVAQGATADLEVAYLVFAKAFPAEPVLAGSTTELTFTIENPDPVNTATGLTFTDDLDAVLPGLAAVGLPLSDVCGVGSELSGTSVITLTGGTLGPGESCTFEVTVSVPPSASMGSFLNVTSPLDGMVGGAPVTGGPASAAQATITIESIVLEIPTLGEWGLLLMAALLGALALRRLRA